MICWKVIVKIKNIKFYFETSKFYIVTKLYYYHGFIQSFHWLGSTALHEAVKEGHDKIVQYLLNNGASVNQKDGYGKDSFLIIIIN